MPAHGIILKKRRLKPMELNQIFDELKKFAERKELLTKEQKEEYKKRFEDLSLTKKDVIYKMVSRFKTEEPNIVFWVYDYLVKLNLD